MVRRIQLAQAVLRLLRRLRCLGHDEAARIKASGDVNKNFAHMMQLHHEESVKMTPTYLLGAKDPQLKASAQRTLKSQH